MAAKIATVDDPKPEPVRQILLRDLNTETEVDALLESAAMEPYRNLMMAVMSGKDSGAAVEAVAALPLEKRYVWRVASALKWAFADLETLNVEADCQTLTPADQERLVALLQMRPLQFCLFLSALVGEEQMEDLMLTAIRTARSVAGQAG